MDQPNPIDAIAATLRQIDGTVDWQARLRSVARMAMLFFSLFLGVLAAYELSQVNAAQSWRAQPAQLISVTLEPPTRAGRDAFWLYRFVLTETGERAQTSDVRPGDMPISFLLWSTASWDAARYQAGQEISVYRAPEGGKAYLERGGYGLMSALLAAVLAFWATLFWRRKKSEAAGGVGAA